MRYLPEQVLKVWSPKPAQQVEALRDKGILSWKQDHISCNWNKNTEKCQNMREPKGWFAKAQAPVS